MNRYPLFTKILMICLTGLLLLIPLNNIESKIRERQGLQHQVQNDIARSASGPQTITGPYLVIRYRLIQRKTTKDDNGNTKVAITESASKETVVMPRNLKIDGNADVEMRSRGIYQARLFNLHSTISGDFVVPQGYGINQPAKDIIPEAAFFVVNISDARGIRNVPVLTLNGDRIEFLPGCVGPIHGNGVHAPLRAPAPDALHTYKFELPFELQGMSTLAFTPTANSTEVALKSSWPHPSFGGSYLPRTRNVDEKGFSAQWQVSNLARNNAGKESANDRESFSVDFIDPVNVYLLSERAVKYGLMFVVLIFTSFFMFEMLRRMRIHPMQYLLVGLAMAMFFLLIISLSEHIPFPVAYAASAATCTGLIGIYLAGVLKHRKPALMFSGGIALLYGLLYGVLQSEDNALLMGTMVMFAALAAVMTLTRNMDWYGQSAAAAAG